MDIWALPCIKIANHKHGRKDSSPFCTDCKIGKRGLCDTFRLFIKKNLWQYSNPGLTKQIAEGSFAKSAQRTVEARKKDIDERIIEDTIESIFKSFDTFRGNERNMEGAFVLFCRRILFRRKADIFRTGQEEFESRNIQIESQFLHDDLEGEDNEDFSLIDNILHEETIPIDGVDFSALEIDVAVRHLCSSLEKMSSKGIPCAEFLRDWYSFEKEGLTREQMAKRIGMKPNSFNKRLLRCIEEVKKYFND